MRLTLSNRRLSLTAAGSTVCAAVSYAASVYASAVDGLGLPQTMTLAVGVAFTVGSLWLQARAQRRREHAVATAEQSARDAAAQVRRSLSDALAPLVQHTARMAVATGAERQDLKGLATSMVLSYATQLASGSRARACFFSLQEGDPRRLHPLLHMGRATAPTTIFEDGTPGAGEVFTALDQGAGRYVRDVRVDPPRGWDSSVSREYRTFIAVPVTAGRRCFGMLTLDSPNPGDLTGEEVPLLRLLASVLASAMAIGAIGQYIPVQLPSSEDLHVAR